MRVHGCLISTASEACLNPPSNGEWASIAFSSQKGCSATMRETLDCRLSTDEDWRPMSIAVLRQMFEQMADKKDPTAIDRFYHTSFVMPRQAAGKLIQL